MGRGTRDRGPGPHGTSGPRSRVPLFSPVQFRPPLPAPARLSGLTNQTLQWRRYLAPQFIYVMKGLRKVIPPSRVILDDIWLSFYPGAKIGVLGPNGSGKSSLLRIMAGVDKDFQGEAWPHKGTKIGWLPQEPQLDPSKDV